MKLKITPLIVISALCVLTAIWIPFAPEIEQGHRSGVNVPWIMPLLMLFGALVAFGADHLIKKYTPELKKVWITELVIVCFTILYAVLLK
jgi:hypothetical protein